MARLILSLALLLTAASSDGWPSARRDYYDCNKCGVEAT